MSNSYQVFVFDTFPKSSEKFLHRELAGTVKNGNQIKVAALKRERKELFPVAIAGVFGDDTSVIDLFFVLFSFTFWKCVFQLLFSVGVKGMFFPIFHISAFGRFKRRFSDADSIHSAHAGWCGVSGWILSRLVGKPFSFSCHAHDVFVQKRIFRFLFKRTQKVVTCNQAAYDQICELEGSNSKLHLIHHPLPKIELRDENKVVPFRLVTAGRAVPKKGFDNLLKAISVTRENFSEVSLIFLGPNPSDFSPSLPPWATAKGFLGGHEFIDNLSRAQIFVYSSRVAPDGDRDGIPNVIIEAMALGIPVVATNAGSIAEVVKDRVTGLLVDPDKPDELARAVSTLIRDQELCQELSENARKLVLEEFDFNKQVSAFCSVLGLKTADSEPDE